jgi:hypothetical protein
VRVYSAGSRVAGEGGAAVGVAAEPTSGEVSGAVLMGARFDVYCFADTADGTQLIAGSRNGLAGVWDVRCLHRNAGKRGQLGEGCMRRGQQRREGHRSRPRPLRCSRMELPRRQLGCRRALRQCRTHR